MKTTKPLHASARQLAALFDHDRDALIREAREAGITPTKDGYDVKRILGMLTGKDPEQMTASGRLTLARAQVMEFRVAKEARQLIPFPEVEREQARIFEIVARCFDNIPDVVERDCGLPKHALIRIEQRLDQARVELHQLLTEAEAPAAGTPE